MNPKLSFLPTMHTPSSSNFHGHTVASRRNSSLELLRILCILLILANHYSVLGGIPARGWRELTWGYFFVQSIGMFGRTACSVFVLISGYYLSTGVKPGHWKKVIPLAAEAVFYSCLRVSVPPGLRDYEYFKVSSKKSHCFP